MQENGEKLENQVDGLEKASYPYLYLGRITEVYIGGY